MGESDARFPRGKGAPTQSPLFWVQQKDRYLRQLLIRDIEELTGRRFCVFFANRFARGSGIQSGDIAYLVEILGDLDRAPLDLLVETNGGETDATEAIISLVRQVAPDFRAVICNAAKSNGTMLALSAKSIMMGVASELGPIEPSVGGHPASTLVRDEVKDENFPLYMAGHHALRQSTMLADRLLRQGMMQGQSEEAISRTVKALTTRDAYASHGSVIDRDEAHGLGLRHRRQISASARRQRCRSKQRLRARSTMQVDSINLERALSIERQEQKEPIWDAIWLLYCMLDNDARKGSLVKIFEGRPRSIAIAAPA